MQQIKHTLIILFTCLTLGLTSLSSPVFADNENPPTSSNQVNINTANAGALSAALTGIGLKKAEAIVTYREAFGDFHDVLELTEVKGIGKATVEKNINKIRVK
jgi:competence protein ComEA